MINVNIQINFLDKETEVEDENSKLFKKMKKSKLKTYFNTLFDNVNEETYKIYLFLEEKINSFPIIFEKNSKNILETINHLKSIAIPNKNVCAEIIETIPCWRCVDCTDYDNIYCSKCFIQSKHLHKGHKIHFLPKIEGMCDCGDPNGFKIFCPEHNGPFVEQKQIDEFIGKSFNENILGKLNIFFDELFLEFSKYLLLTEQCNFFCEEIFMNNIHNAREKEDVILLKNNFGIVFQNFLSFIYLITNNNTGMLYLISKYLLKNHLSSQNLEEKFATFHTCIKLENKNIQIYKENGDCNNNIFCIKTEDKIKKHNCECFFLRLLLSNWRENIKSIEENQNEILLLSFTHNIFLKKAFAILNFFLFKEISFNNNNDIIACRPQYYNDDYNILIGKQTNIIENIFILLYDYFKNILNLPDIKDLNGGFNKKIMKNLSYKLSIISNDFDYFIKPKSIILINSKINLMKIIIDITCLIHNINGYKSIYPHPEFIEKTFSFDLLTIESYIINIMSCLCACNDWKDQEKIKYYFEIIINKILNQKKENIIQLEKNEFSFHLLLYRIFGFFINYFSFNYILNNNDKNLFDSFEYIKNNLFKSKEEFEKVIDLIIDDYFKMYGFIIGIRNGCFNYYDSLDNYYELYFNKLKFIKIDFTIIKFLLVMSEKKINLERMLMISNIENINTFFNRIFKDINLDNINNKENKDKIDEDEKKHIFQWVRLFQIIISIMKNNSTFFDNILIFYNSIISSKVKLDFFNKIKNNTNLMIDLKNNLKKNLILNFISNGNWVESQKIEQIINEYYFKLFNKKEFSDILDELTMIKVHNKKNIYILKDSSLKYLDLDYYFSPVNQSKAELYLNDFKKDIFKFYNSYYFNPSPLMFDFHNKAFENILLNSDNIQLLTNIIEVLLNKNKNTEIIKSIREAFLPVILKFIAMFGNINSKNFIKYKLENKNVINKIIDILNSALENNKTNIIFDKDLSENISNTIKQLNKYQIIYNSINENINDLNDFSYNEDFIYKENSNSNLITVENSEINLKKEKSNKIKEKYKNLIKKKRNNFIEKIQKDKRMTNIIEEKDLEDEKDEILCYFCRNSINLKSFEKPYGKFALIDKDFFYQNSFKSSLKKELNKIMKNDIEEKNKIYSTLKEKNIEKNISIRITSCGHYFHQKCFKEKLSQLLKVKCPICEKLGNALIPPLINFHDSDIYLQPEKLDNILDKNYEPKKIEIKENKDIFKEINICFLESLIKTKLKQTKIKDSKNIINELFINYEYNMNYLKNLYGCDASTFYKKQQIDNIRNIILVIRYLIKIDYIDINQIINNIRNEINDIIKGPNEKDNIIEKYKNIHYSKQIDKIIFLFLLLIDNNDIQKLFIYVINWSLPYFIFWIYLRNIIVENNFYSLYEEKTINQININSFEQFLNSNNKLINDYLQLFLQKLLLIKIIIDFNYNKDDIFNNINNISIENIFHKFNISNIFQIIPKNIENEIQIKDLFTIFPTILNLSNPILSKDYIILDSNIIFNSFINNIIKIKEEKYLLNAEFFYQFILYKFNFIELEYNIFDFIEKYIFKKCDKCNKQYKQNYLCLICGNKICQECIFIHTVKCEYYDIIYIDLQTMKLIYIYNFQQIKLLSSLYTNKYNEEPNSDCISNDFYLNKEKYELVLKNFICNDFHLD